MPRIQVLAYRLIIILEQSFEHSFCNKNIRYEICISYSAYNSLWHVHLTIYMHGAMGG